MRIAASPVDLADARVDQAGDFGDEAHRAQ
jgi:hypothetical protein